MTNEEAIEVLEVHKAHWERLLDNGICDVLEGGNTIQAFNVAIRALKNEQTEQNVGMCQQNVGEMSERQTDGDLISRTDLLNKIFQQAEGRDYDGNIMLNLPYVDLIKSMPTITAEQKTAEWIPVFNRLPEYDEDIIITHEGSMGQPITSVSYFDGDFRTEDGEGYFSEVIAWMPLPEPYKKGDTEWKN